MAGGLISTMAVGAILEKKDLYADLAAESYLDMADDPEFWKKMSDGLSDEEKANAEKIMAKLKQQKDGVGSSSSSTNVVNRNDKQNEVASKQEVQTKIEKRTAASGVAKEETERAPNDNMFSDY